MKLTKILMLASFLLVCLAPLVNAELDLSEELSTEEEEALDNAMSPVAKVYRGIKYATGIIAPLGFLIAGVLFMVSGGNSSLRSTAKVIVSTVVIGVIVIIAGPYLLEFLGL